MGYFKEVAKEMKRVTWPSLGDVSKYTWTVIVMIVFLGAFFGGVDFVLSKLMDLLYSL